MISALVLAAVLHWSIIPTTEWTELRRRLVPGRTLDLVFTLRVNAPTCAEGRWWGPNGWMYLKGCQTILLDNGEEDFLYERRECKTTGCSPWVPQAQVWCSFRPGVSGAQGCPCFFASEPGCVETLSVP